MDAMTVFVLAFGIGVITGLRSFMAPTVVSWAAHLHWINLQNSWPAFLGYAATPYILSVLAAGELVVDKLPNTPSRKAPAGFTARIVMGALAGAALGIAGSQSWVMGAVLGGIGGVAGTLGGYEARSRLVKALNAPDIVIALAEDAVAIGGGFFLVSRF